MRAIKISAMKVSKGRGKVDLSQNFALDQFEHRINLALFREIPDIEFAYIN